MNWDAWKPLATLIFTSLLKFAGGLLVAHGLATNGPGLEAIGGAATTAAGALWSWWVQKGHLAAADYLKKLTDTATTAAAVAVAKQMAPAATTGAAQEAHQEVAIETGKIVPKAAPIVLLAILILGTLAFPGDAMAAQVGRPQVTGDFIGDAKANLRIASKPAGTAALSNIATILAKPFQDIADFIGADADAAIALSTAIPNLQDGHGQQCWIAMKSFGDIIKAHPIPITLHIINDYESLRLLGIATNNLCSNVHCTQVFADFTGMAQAASPMPLAIPSLHDLCTKVPQIAVVPPVTVPAPPN